MTIRLLAALTAAAALSACGVDSIPQSSGSAPASQSAAPSAATGASSTSAPAPAADQAKSEPEKTAEGEKKAE